MASDAPGSSDTPSLGALGRVLLLEGLLPMKNVFKYFLGALFALALCVLTLALLNAWRGLRDMSRKVNELEAKLEKDDAVRAELRQRIYELEYNPQAVEKVAREKGRLCRKGDLILIYAEASAEDQTSKDNGN